MGTDNSGQDKKTADWNQSLGFRLTIYHFVFLISLIISTIVALFYIEDKLLVEQGHDQIQQLGNRIVAELGQRISTTETMTKSLARLGEDLEKKEEVFKKVIPSILDFQGDDKIAGGGIWPEPFKFDSQKQRRSFFWGREADGSLQYFDDYNDMDGPGYHNEEWYVPARYLKSTRVYWSKSYMDPYSYEPMVTCTAPMFINGEFSGVSTVDLKLTGLGEFFSEKAKIVDGYIFAVDRNNKLLSFPDLKIAKSYTPDEKGKITEEFLTFEELTNKKEDFSSLRDELSSINQDLKNKHQDERLKLQAQLIAKNSYQIEDKEAELIASMLNAVTEPVEKNMENKADPILDKSALYSIFLMPETGWKIIVVSPTEKVNAFASKVTYSILIVIVILELIILMAMLFIIKSSVTNPLTSMCEQLRQTTNLEEGEQVKLSEQRNDELGLLAHEINKRSTLIQDVIDKLKNSNVGLEKRVMERTAEIESALKQLEEAKENAETANKSKSLFLANMSHEIRTPMNAILGYTDIIYKKIDDPKLKDHLSTIKNSGRTLLNLINDILDLSKVEAGKIDLHYEIVNPKNIFSNTLMQFKESAEKKNISLKLNMETELPDAALMDQNRINQILTNIVGNAIKFTNEGSVILSIEKYDNNTSELTFSVKDTGVGIPEDKIETIFDNFVQIEQKNSANFGGTGLGLAITEKLVKLMDGEIKVKSKFGKGTKFTVIIRNVEPIAVRDSKEETHENFVFDKSTILVVDDIEINRNLIISMFEDFPFTIHEAANGEEAVNLVKKKDFDLILMDMKMPIMDGYEATKEIKKIKGSPVIAVTASALKASEEEIRVLCDGYLRKPINENDLFTEMARFLNHRKVLKENVKASVEEDNTDLVLIMEDLNQEIEDAAANLEIKQLNSLIDKLEKVNGEHSSPEFDQWVWDLKTEFNNFNMEGLAEQLRSFKEVRQKVGS